MFWLGMGAAVEAKYGTRCLDKAERDEDLRTILSKTSVFVRLLQVLC